MTFVTVSHNREQLASLGRLLITLIPGCTIHQNCDPLRAIQCLSYQSVDAVFADVDAVSDMMNLLNAQKTKAQIWLLCHQGTALPQKAAECYGILSYPITEHKMRDALQMGLPGQKRKNNIR